MPGVKPPWEEPPIHKAITRVFPHDGEKLNTIHLKWCELDELQIKLHMDCVSSRKWAVLNSLDAIGLELTKPGGYPAIKYYIDEKMETIERALKDLEFDGEIIG